jgi:hypothetical protein
MNMIGHQAVRVHGTIESARELLQSRQIHHPITVHLEAVSTVVPALNDVHGNAWKDQSGLPSHMLPNGALVPAVDRNRGLTPI